MSPAHYIAIEGPLRVGKSSLARALAERLHARTLLDSEKNPFLEGFYRGEKGAAFRTQMYFLMSRFRQLQEAGIEDSHNPVVVDFLFEKDFRRPLGRPLPRLLVSLFLLPVPDEYLFRLPLSPLGLRTPFRLPRVLFWTFLRLFQQFQS